MACVLDTGPESNVERRGVNLWEITEIRKSEEKS